MSHYPPSDAMLAMLRSLRDSGDPFRHLSGQSAMGGAEGTRAALVRRRWMVSTTAGWHITEAGLAALTKADGQ